MGTRASAEATRTGHRSDPPGPPGAQPLPARTHHTGPVPAQAPAPEAPAAARDPAQHAHGCRYASAELDPEPAAAAHARTLTREHLALWDMNALTDDAATIATELISNAIKNIPRRSTGLTLTYAIHATPGQLRITVWDIGPGHPQPRPPDPQAETGRGLHMISELTGGNWGWHPCPSGGKVVYATLTQPTAPDDTA
jgi:anti-sigma regulatory factor (Ser/Thr protein kinase)